MFVPRVLTPARDLSPPRSAAVILVSIVLATGCGTLADGRAWGSDVTLRPGVSGLTRATGSALKDPWTWVPATLAALLVVTDADEDLSDWAIEETPIFGSNESAADASDDWRTVLLGSALVTTLATRSGDTGSEWWAAKAKGFGLAAGTVWATDTITDMLKDEMERLRPDGSDLRSFPSQHTSQAFVSSAWAARNLRYVRMSDGGRRTAQAALTAAAVLTGWARVEAGAHYPSDVLSGAALGNFMAHFASEAFLGLPSTTRMEWIVDPFEGNYGVMFHWRP